MNFLNSKMSKWSDHSSKCNYLSFIGNNPKGFSLEYYGIISQPKETGFDSEDHVINLPENRNVVVNVNALEIALDPPAGCEIGGGE